MSAGMSENEETVAQIVTVIIAFAIVPTILVAGAASAGQWLLERGVLVGTSDAVVQVPFTEGGLDLQRIIVALAATVAILAIASTWRRGASKTRSEGGRR